MLVPIKEQLTAKWPTEDQIDWQTAGGLLQPPQDEQVARLLHQAQVAAVQKGQTAEADILALLGYVWLAVNQTQSEVAWHQQACAQASRREQELKQQLMAILALFNRGEMPDAASPVGSSHNSAFSISDEPGANLDTQLLGSIKSLLDRNESSPQFFQSDLPIAPPKTIEPTPMEPASATLVIHCLGPFRAYLNGQPVTGWNSLKSQAILKYLVAHHDSYTSKDFLMDLFWPEADPKAARRNLHQAIYCLRQTLKQGHDDDAQFIQFENDCYSLNPDLTLWLDTAEFERFVQAGRRLESAGQPAAAMAEYSRAEALYQGDFLEDELYEDWTSWPREHFRTTYLDLADRLSQYYLEQGKIELSIALCHKMLGRDNCYEPAHRRLMECYYSQGQRNLALRQYQLCVQTLRDELKMQPSSETQALYQNIAESTDQPALGH
jgi:DNA-binding SARP family transcriptional activator